MDNSIRGRRERRRVVRGHSITDGKEGQHYFFNRAADRVAKDGAEIAFSRLPKGIGLDIALSTLDGMGSDHFAPFGFTNAMLGMPAPPLWLVSMMTDLLFDDDSDDSTDF